MLLKSEGLWWVASLLKKRSVWFFQVTWSSSIFNFLLNKIISYWCLFLIKAIHTHRLKNQIIQVILLKNKTLPSHPPPLLTTTISCSWDGHTFKTLLADWVFPKSGNYMLFLPFKFFFSTWGNNSTLNGCREDEHSVISLPSLLSQVRHPSPSLQYSYVLVRPHSELWCPSYSWTVQSAMIALPCLPAHYFVFLKVK